MESQKYTHRILMLPWLAYGHIYPFLELAKRLAQRNLFIYLCSTPANLSSIADQLKEKPFPSIKILHLHLPDQLPNLPSHLHTTKSLPPHLMPYLKQAFDLSHPSFTQILKSIRPHLLIYDVLQPWAPAAAASLNIPAIMFSIFSAAPISFFFHLCQNTGAEFGFPAICPEEHEAQKMCTVHSSSASDGGISDLERFKECIERSCDLVAIKTFREMEGKYLDHLTDQIKKKVLPVGPLIEEESLELETRFRVWLDSKERGSTVFVSFGSEYFMSKEEIEEVAHGLDISQANFIWVLRSPHGATADLEEVLPSGFLEKVKNRGMVVEDWVPQRIILRHPSIGGFLTHCGSSAIMEGMSSGVPMIALPLHLDQPIIARLVVELGVAVEIKREHGEEAGRFGREEVGKRIREVLMEQSGESTRKKAGEMSDKMMSGRRDEEIDVLVEEMIKLCNKESAG